MQTQPPLGAEGYESGADQVHLEFQGGRLELGAWGECFRRKWHWHSGICRVGKMGTSRAEGGTFGAKAWSSVSNLLSALEGSFSEDSLKHSLSPYSYVSSPGKAFLEAQRRQGCSSGITLTADFFYFQYLMPFFLNQCGSLLYYLTLASTGGFLI